MILYVQALMDFKTLLLSQPLSFLLILIGLVVNLGFEIFAVPLDALLGLLFGYGLLFSINMLYKMLRSQDGIGSGDFLLLSGIGSILGASAIGPILLLGLKSNNLYIYDQQRSKDQRITPGIWLGVWWNNIFINADDTKIEKGMNFLKKAWSNRQAD